MMQDNLRPSLNCYVTLIERFVFSFIVGSLIYIVSICHFTVVYLVATSLSWSEAEGDHVVIETSI